MRERHGSTHPTLRTIVTADVVRFSRRRNSVQLAVRASLYRVLESAFQSAGVDWTRCVHEDRGDGAMIIVPADVSVLPLIELMPQYLAWLLARHNAAVEDPALQFALRIAIHAGQVHQDPHGYAGTALNSTFRLLDSAPIREAASDTTSVAIIVSDHVYQSAEPYRATTRQHYRRVDISVKETEMAGWIHVPEPVRPPAGAQAARRRMPPVAVVGTATLLVIVGVAVTALFAVDRRSAREPAAASTTNTRPRPSRNLSKTPLASASPSRGSSPSPSHIRPSPTTKEPAPIPFAAQTDPTPFVVINGGGCITGASDGDVYSQACNEAETTLKWQLRQALGRYRNDLVYQFTETNSQECLTRLTDVPEGGAGTVGLRRCATGRPVDQLWHMTILGHQRGWTYFQLAPVDHQQECMDLMNNATADGSPFILWKCYPVHVVEKNQNLRVLYY